DPPKRVLYFVARNFWLFLVHVRQIVAEPAIKCIAEFIPIRMRRKQSTIVEAVDGVLAERTVKPIVEGWISGPGMSRANVIGYLVLNNLQPQGMRFLD